MFCSTPLPAVIGIVLPGNCRRPFVDCFGSVLNLRWPCLLLFLHVPAQMGFLVQIDVLINAKKRTKKELQVNQCSSTSSETVRQTKVQSVLSFIIIHQHVLKYLRDESVAAHLSLSAGQSKQAETS